MKRAASSGFPILVGVVAMVFCGLGCKTESKKTKSGNTEAAEEDYSNMVSEEVVFRPEEPATPVLPSATATTVTAKVVALRPTLR